jgi:hypothetical protein
LAVSRFHRFIERRSPEVPAGRFFGLSISLATLGERMLIAGIRFAFRSQRTPFRAAHPWCCMGIPPLCCILYILVSFLHARVTQIPIDSLISGPRHSPPLRA